MSSAVIPRTWSAYVSHVAGISAWRCIANFGCPVDPDVQSQKPGDSAQVSATDPSEPAPTKSAHPNWPSPLAPDVMTVSTSEAPSRSSVSDCSRAADIATTRARESATITPRSRPGSNGFIGTGTAPIRIAPRNIATNSTESSITIATLSSERTPRTRSPAAAASTRCSTSA